MQSKLSQLRWKSPSTSIRTLAFAEVVTPLAPLARLLQETGIPDLSGTPREKTVDLLRMAAEVEHAFVVQYLYGAFSLDQTIASGKNWYQVLFKIAKEEMGHLVTVQNLLSMLNEQPHLDRQSYPAPSSYPFEKILKRFALDWLGDFVIAESPVDPMLPPGLPPSPEMQKVGAIYMNLYWLFKESEEPGPPWPIPNHGFPPDHLVSTDFAEPQLLTDWLMTPADWQVAPEPPGAPKPGLRILGHGPFNTRDQERLGALSAIYDVAAQGEGPIPQANSHFERLSRVYVEASALAVLPVKRISDNPHTTPTTARNPEIESGLITHLIAGKLATLFNLRYAMLLTEIGHAARTRRGIVVDGVAVRSTLTDWAVSNEMRFLHDLSDQLNAQPLKASNTTGTDLRASAPFELPVKLPSGDHDCWQSYLDVFDRTTALVNEIGSAVGDLATIIKADDARRAFVVDRLRQP